MLTSFLNKFDFSNPRISGEILFFVALIWCIVVACAVWSIFVKMRSWPARTFWTLMVVGVPVVGLLLYLPFSMDNDALQSFVRFGRRG
jgi:hypothetical protein